jgi:hypothetical protein
MPVALKTAHNTIPSWLLPCTCYLPRCKCPARLRLDILCILEAPPTNEPPFTPNPNLKVQIFEFTYCNNYRFHVEATNQKLDKHAILHPILSQLGWIVLPPIIIIAGIRGNSDTTTVKVLQDLQIPNSKIQKLMESFSQIAIRYLTHIILNIRELKKETSLGPT